MDERNDYNSIPNNFKMETTKLNNMKQTAVEWLKEQYIDRGETIPSGVFKQAKEMEMEHIIAAANFLPHDEQNEIKTPEEYYNETYNQKQHIIDIMKADEEDRLYTETI